MNYDRVVNDIAGVSGAARSAASRAVNQLLTIRNWLIGAYIIEFEQNGEDRAAYGNRLLKSIVEDLARRGETRLSETNLKYFRQFALAYPAIAIGQTLSDEFRMLTESLGQTENSAAVPRAPRLQFPSLEARQAERTILPWQTTEYYTRLFRSLSWSHLLELVRIDDPTRRAFYELECLKSRWSVRELKRQINTMLYERAGLSKDKDALMTLAEEGRLIDSPSTILRDPYVLEFLGLEERPAYTESDLEQALNSWECVPPDLRA
ncbi:MAG TPA: DUF1016 N-terminal domain-containing protein [Blastocatellia bacterium]|nr:DUF1016 N-terminal domain-containing protein [Blastocatellia bacterium]